MEAPIIIGLLIAAGAFGYCAGKIVGAASVEGREVKLKDDLRITRNRLLVAQHNYAAVEGLWATDRPNLITSPRLKSLFYRIGYPGEKL